MTGTTSPGELEGDIRKKGRSGSRIEEQLHAAGKQKEISQLKKWFGPVKRQKKRAARSRPGS